MELLKAEKTANRLFGNLFKFAGARHKSLIGAKRYIDDKEAKSLHYCEPTTQLCQDEDKSKEECNKCFNENRRY